MNEDVKKLIDELRAEGAGGVVDRLTNRAANALEKAEGKLARRKEQADTLREHAASQRELRKAMSEKVQKLEARVQWLSERNQDREDQADRLARRAEDAEAQLAELSTPVEGVREKLARVLLPDSAWWEDAYHNGDPRWPEEQRYAQERAYKQADAILAAFPTLGREAEIRADERERIIADLIGPATRLDATVRAFKQGWHLADSQGRTGERVQEGLQAVVSDRIRRYGREADAQADVDRARSDAAWALNMDRQGGA